MKFGFRKRVASTTRVTYLRISWPAHRYFYYCEDTDPSFRGPGISRSKDGVWWG